MYGDEIVRGELDERGEEMARVSGGGESVACRDGGDMTDAGDRGPEGGDMGPETRGDEMGVLLVEEVNDDGAKGVCESTLCAGPKVRVGDVMAASWRTRIL